MNVRDMECELFPINLTFRCPCYRLIHDEELRVPGIFRLVLLCEVLNKYFINLLFLFVMNAVEYVL